MTQSNKADDFKEKIERTRASTDEAKKAAKEVMQQYKEALKELARR